MTEKTAVRHSELVSESQPSRSSNINGKPQNRTETLSHPDNFRVESHENSEPKLFPNETYCKSIGITFKDGENLLLYSI